jgi:hypothetical protein
MYIRMDDGRAHVLCLPRPRPPNAYQPLPPPRTPLGSHITNICFCLFAIRLSILKTSFGAKQWCFLLERLKIYHILTYRKTALDLNIVSGQQ